MKILYDSHIFAAQKMGGISRYHYELLKGMNLLGQEARVAGLFIKNRYLLSDKKYGHLMFNDTKSLFAGLNNIRLHRHLTNVTSYDIYHPTDSYAHLLRGLPPDKKMVFTIHDMITEKQVAGAKPWPEKLNFARKADKIIAVSENTKRDIIDIFGIESNKIEVVYHGSSLQLTKAQKPKRPLPQRYLLFVGGRGGYKNFDAFISATAPIIRKDRDLFVVCAGGKSFSGKELHRLKELNISDHVISVVGMSDNELSYIYANSIAFIFPSLYEGFGIPILEAWACNTPVLLSNASCFPEIAGDAALYFDPNNPSSITEIINTILVNVSLQKDIIQRGTKRLELFSWNKTVKQTLAIYQSLIS
jgi:glycosyltransferase involved in cell wall biosynthesis